MNFITCNTCGNLTEDKPDVLQVHTQWHELLQKALGMALRAKKEEPSAPAAPDVP